MMIKPWFLLPLLTLIACGSGDEPSLDSGSDGGVEDVSLPDAEPDAEQTLPEPSGFLDVVVSNNRTRPEWGPAATLSLVDTDVFLRIMCTTGSAGGICLPEELPETGTMFERPSVTLNPRDTSNDIASLSVSGVRAAPIGSSGGTWYYPTNSMALPLPESLNLQANVQGVDIDFDFPSVTPLGIESRPLEGETLEFNIAPGEGRVFASVSRRTGTSRSGFRMALPSEGPVSIPLDPSAEFQTVIVMRIHRVVTQQGTVKIRAASVDHVTFENPR